MNKLFIIGNGFDLAHGLKTSYNDFLHSYLSDAINKYNSQQVYKDELISIISKFRSGHKIPEQQNITQTLSILKTENDYYKFGQYGNFIQTIISEVESKNWVDIEQLYYDELKGLITAIDNNPVKTHLYKQSILELNECLSFLKSKLHKYLSELTLNGGLVNKGINAIFENEILNTKSGNISKAKSISLGYSNKPFDNIAITSFNYTDTHELYVKQGRIDENTNIDLISIHGSISNIEKMIFGYGDEMDEHYKIIEKKYDNELLTHFKSFGYYKDNQYQKLLRFIEAEKFEVHLMGHSCGLSDRVLLNTIFEHDNCDNIKIYYHDKGDNQNNFTELTMNISRHFNDKAKMRARIKPIDECKPLS